jgi:hypothetical protein
MGKVDEIQAQETEHVGPVEDTKTEGMLPRNTVIFHCQTCPGARKVVLIDRDYVPTVLICSRCKNRVKPRFRSTRED